MGLLLFCVFCFTASVKVQALEMVLVFSQLQESVTNLYPQTRTRMILGHLRRFDVEEVGVMVRTRDLRKAAIKDKVKAYSDAGHLLINQGHNYHLFTRPDLRRYQVDLLRGHGQLSAYASYRGHTYLRELEYSANQDSRGELERFSRARGLVPVFVDLRVQDNVLNYLYQQAVSRRRQLDMGQLQDAWVELLWPQLVEAWYEQLALGGGPLVLVLEEHDLTAYFLPGLMERMQAVGGRFVAPSVYFAPAPQLKSPASLTHASLTRPEPGQSKSGQASAYLARLLQMQLPRHQPLVLGGEREWARVVTEQFPTLLEF